METCKGPECNKNTNSASGLCSSHNAQIKRGRELTPLGSTKKVSNTECAASFCDRLVEGRSHLCRAHTRQFKAGQELTPVGKRTPKPQSKPERKFKRICLRWNCDKTATTGEFCGYHREDTRFSHSPVCRVEGCTRPATFIPSTGACPEHGDAA